MLIIYLIHAIYIYVGFFSLCCTPNILFYLTFYIDLFKILHVFIILKEKLVFSFAPHFMGHVDFLLIEQVSAHSLYVYFLNLDRGVRLSLA